MNHKVFVVIPVHNRLEYTKKCLASLENQSYKDFDVIVVNDGSTDGTSSSIKKKYPQWTVLKGNGKWWWTKSMYMGVKRALETSRKGDFILSMNNDCYFKRNYLSQIVKASQQNKRAIVGSLILDAEKPKKVIDAGVKINWKRNLIYGVADKISDKLKFYTDREIIKDIDTLPGKGSLIPIEVFGKIGNFNYKKLPHYIADYEFFCRAKRGGFKLIVSSKSRLYNFAKQTGSSHIDRHSASYKEIFGLLFGRKSKLNLTDHINFLLLCCPKKYLLRNFKDVLNKTINYGLMLFPFYYIKVFLDIFHKLKYRTRVLLHNLPIYFRQNPVVAKVRLAVHDISIYIRQNKVLKKIRKTFSLNHD